MENDNINKNLGVFGEVIKNQRECCGDGCDGGCHGGGKSRRSGTADRVRFAFENPEDGI